MERVAYEIMDKYDFDRVVITLNRRGSYVRTRDGESIRFYGLNPRKSQFCNTLEVGSSASETW